MMTFLKNNIFGVIATVGIIVLSTIPIPDDPPLGGVPFIDKWVHFVMYGGVSVAMWLDLYFVRRERTLSGKFGISMLLYPVLLGGLMEIVQEYLTTYRNGDMLDFYADWFGAYLGGAVGLVLFLLATKVAGK